MMAMFPALLLVLATGAAAPGSSPEGTPPTLPAGLPEGWYARIDTTEGVILAHLLPDQSPQAVAYFAGLAEGRVAWTDILTGVPGSGPYYDGIAVHKVKAGQRFEAGDRTGTSRGAPQYWIPETEGHGPVDFSRGYRMGMTSATRGRISGALFFVTVTALPYLNEDHPCFAELVSGQEVAQRISEAKANSDLRPLDPPVIRSIRILKSGDPPPLPEPKPYKPTVPVLRPLKRPNP